ncbi:P-loop containing nucleoside triphosphate hydrolase protein [Terfezia boudieri ATCC MYA-4762]|uniref:P-loop containing nucleoside triphosphate hydrolase protein n=1 Tax=Terfezia boudieri ATCC MYA-4762 TaxID=1051890 RepID=A0A3N4LJE2_9PEZI|nr:P-loop containing nucleoside triphosphate hydrolase protein [Terfezia boudieri ATCC MYA-4762]
MAIDVSTQAAVSTGTLAVVSLCIIPFLYRNAYVLRNRKSYKLVDSVYRDEDGVATKESQKRYSVRIQKYLLVLSCVAGTALALSDAIQITVKRNATEAVYLWLHVATWMLLTIQSIYTFLEPRCTHVFSSAARLAPLLSLVGMSVAGVVTSKRGELSAQLSYGQIGAAVLAIIVSINIPRRPDVYNDKEELIDQMRTVSIYSRYSFGWANRLLWKAAREGRLEETDLPKMDARRRATILEEGFYKVKNLKDSSLLIHLAKAHAPTFILQTLMTLVASIVTFSPQFFLYKILKVMEARNAGVDVGYAAWLWVAALGLNKLLDAVLLAFLYWLSFMGLNIPIRSQLSAVIFRKTLLKKDVKGSQKVEEGEQGENLSSLLEEDEGDDDDDLKNLKQGKINLLAIDATRIADLAAYSNVFAESFFGIVIGFSGLVVIIGWKSLLAGLAVVLFIIPINIMVSKRYAEAQDKLMKIRDQKMAAVSEALQGIRQIKFSALEKQWEERIFEVRREELKTLRSAFINDTLLIACWIANPVLLSVAALSVYSYINGSLLPSTAFTALAIFNELEFVLSVVPEVTTELLDAVVSSKRIQDYLHSAEKVPYTKFADEIAIRDACIAWAADGNEDAKDRFVLREVNIDFPKHELSLVSGKTGSGKSLLLAALLGEADLLKGHVELPEPPNWKLRFDSKATPANWVLPNAIAYVAQIPWMENASIRDNVLFGLPYDDVRYKKTIHACALEQDFSMLTDGEFTEIGANGINLSGGQRWRVSFARALYSRAGILILDDIFSAVDAHVGRHIFEEGLCGDLAKGRTRILVTHHMKLCLPKAKYTVILDEGLVAHAGLVEALKTAGKLTDILDSDESTDVEEGLLVDVIKPDAKRNRRQSEHRGQVAEETAKPPPRQFVQTEERERGSVKRAIYWSYMKASGGFSYWALIAMAFGLQECIVVGRTWFVKMWTSYYETGQNFMPSLTQFTIQQVHKAGHGIHVAMEEKSIGYWIGMYTVISLMICIVGSSRYYLVFYASLRASNTLFQDLTKTVLRAPLRWLDTVPMGRVLNRFSKDFETIDSRIANDVSSMVYNSLALVGVVAAGFFLTVYMVPLAATMLAISAIYASYYLSGAREVKRLESNSRSPIFEFFGSTLTGVATIRAFGKTEEYIEQMYQKIDHYSACTFYVWLFNHWVSYRLTLLGTFFILIVGIVVVGMPNTNASLAGFALSFAMGFSMNVIWFIRRYANVELDMNSMERIVEYTQIEIERQDGVVPPAHWPSQGRVEVTDLVVSYAPDLPPVLKGISFTVEPRQRLGVVGRTGAGKSSLTLALFQFIHASEGKILIDGLDTSKITLHDLRSRMAIIPQDPVLFSGTVRSNLDAFGEHTNEKLQEALERVHLIPSGSNSVASPSATESGTATSQPAKNSNPFSSLNSPISEGGLNLSQGQRQLLCLARAIVSRPKILVLDEATSAVDMHTEELIRESMNEEFKDCTTVVIAHRLATVVGYDRIMVLGEGKVVEFGTPWELLQKEDGAFSAMVRESGEEQGLRRMAREAARVLVEV